MKLLPEGWVENFIGKIYKHLDAGNKYAMEKRMKSDPEFRRQMEKLMKTQRGLEDYVAKARRDPEISKLMDKILKNKD